MNIVNMTLKKKIMTLKNNCNGLNTFNDPKFDL